MGEMTTTTPATAFGALERDFACPKCGGHQFMTEWAGENWAPWRIACHNDECEWSGRYREHVYKNILEMPPEALFRRLREMGADVMGEFTNPAAMEANRAALPKPPAYVGELKGTFSRKEILSALVAADSPAAIPALFAQLRKMGVSCASCRQRELYGECQMDLVEDHFLCNEWSSDPKNVTSAPPEG